jgi:hypothetical protein
VGPRHADEGLGPVETDGGVAQIAKAGQIPSRAAAKVQDGERTIGEVPQKGRDVLGHVVVARARPERFGGSVVVADGGGGSATELSAIQRGEGTRGVGHKPVARPKST